MKSHEDFYLTMQSGDEGLEEIPDESRVAEAVAPARPTVSAEIVATALEKTNGSEKVLTDIPELIKWPAWLPVATFTVCQKTGTATYLDIWDSDQFDGVSDMQNSLSDCRVWFAADGYASWGSPQTKTGRINCFFRAPENGNYVCNAQLQSHGGSALVECLIDSSSFGALPVNGTINQPHPCSLTAGWHHFRIRQLQGSFFFLSLSVFKV